MEHDQLEHLPEDSRQDPPPSTEEQEVNAQRRAMIVAFIQTHFSLVDAHMMIRYCGLDGAPSQNLGELAEALHAHPYTVIYHLQGVCLDPDLRCLVQMLFPEETAKYNRPLSGLKM